MSKVRYSNGNRFVELDISDSRLPYDKVQELIKEAWNAKYKMVATKTIGKEKNRWKHPLN